MPRTIADFRAAYAKADALSTEAQNFRNKASIPAASELRYAGHHFLKAISDTYQLSDQEELELAISHTRRACYEATETGIMFAIAIVRKFQADFDTISIGSIIPDYVPRLRRCNEGMRLLEVGRQPGYDRAGDHQNRIDVFHDLRTFCDDLDAGRDEANKAVARARRRDRQFLMGALIGLLALAVTILFGWPEFKKSTWPNDARIKAARSAAVAAPNSN